MKSVKVLIADDNAGVRRVLSAFLRAGDRSVLEAADGLAALELARTCLPDLIILDVRMPGRDGHQVCAELRENASTRGIPILMLSGAHDAEFMGIGSGANGYLAKPFNLNDLSSRVDTMLGVPS